jgi:hypothetical protein
MKATHVSVKKICVCPNKVNEHDKHVKTNAKMTPNIKWSCHVNFDNLDLNFNSCRQTYQYVLHIIIF